MKRFLLRQVSLALLSVLLLNLAVFGQSSPKNIYTKSQTLKANDPKYLNKPYQLHRVTMKSGVKYLVHAHGPFPTNFHLFTSKGKGIVQAKHQNNHAYYYFTPNTDDNYLIVVTTRDVKRVGKYDLRVLEYPKVVVKGGGTMSQTAKDIQSKVTQTGKLILNQVGTFARTAFSTMSLDQVKVSKNGSTVTGKAKFGRFQANMLLQNLVQPGKGNPAWALAVTVQGRKISEVLDLPYVARQAIDQFDISAPILVFAPQAATIPSANLSPEAKSFFDTVYKLKGYSVRLEKGVNLLTSARFRRGSPGDRILQRIGITNSELQIQGVALKNFDPLNLNQARRDGKLKGELMKSLSLRATLAMTNVKWLPKGWKPSAYIEITGAPSVALGLNLQVPTQYPNQYQTFTASLGLTKIQGGAAVELRASYDGLWRNACGINGLDLQRVALLLGIDTKLNLSLGLQGRFTVRAGSFNKTFDLAGKIKIDLKTGIPSDLAFRVGSKTHPINLSSREIVGLANHLARLINPRARTINPANVPDIRIKNFYFSFAPKDGDRGLQIPKGIALNGELYDANTQLAKVSGNVVINGLSSRLKLYGRIADIKLKGLEITGVEVDVDLSASLSSYFKVKGRLKLLGTTKSVDIKIDRNGMYCRYTDKLNGVFDAEITIRSTNSWTYWQVDGKVNIKELTETAKKVAGFFNASLPFTVDEIKFAGTVSPSMVRFGLQIKYTWNGQSQVFKKRVNLDQISPNAVALLLKDKLAPFVKELEKAVHLVGRKISGYGINKTFKQVQNSTKTPLNDGDVIQLLELPGDRKIPRGHVRIILGFGGRVSWWKGILLFKKNSDVLKRAVVAGEKKEVPKKVGFFYAHIPVTDLTKYDLVLSKAKTFGVHANMYRITDAARNMKAGKTYIFSWTKD